MPDSSSSTNKSNSVTTASLVSSVCSVFSLSARVKACECVRLCTSMCVYFHGDNRACLSDCVSLIIAVISYWARASAKWLEKKSHFLSLFKLHHTLWQDHLLTKTHGRLIWIYARHTHTRKHMQTGSAPTPAAHARKDKHTTWSVRLGDMVELKFTRVNSTYLSLMCFSNWKTPCYYASYFYSRGLTSIFPAW